ncbi:MAG TPA: glycosyltransferase family 39 protein [Candidatus Nitrosotalea sp.]|nr:glycosyltransferase family 39 protein [Candidatus Nitrosotalea sp.]
MSLFSRLTHSQLEKGVSISWIIIMSCIIAWISFSIYQNYNAASFLFDDNLYMSETNSLLHGHGFTINVLYPLSKIDLSTGISQDYSNADTLIEKYPNLNWEYSRAPVFFILLASFFEITKANPSNWVTFASIFNTIVSIFFITFYFIIARKYFGTLVGILSSVIIITSLLFIMGITTAEPNQLTYLFIILSLLFLKKSSKHYILFAIFAALANLTNTVGIIPIAAYGSYLLFKREYRGLAIVMVTWIVILSPWMIRDFYTFHDFGSDLGIPFSSQISSFFISNPSGNSPEQYDLAPHMQSPLIKSPFEFIYNFFFKQTTKTELIVFFLPFLFISYLSISKIANNFNKRKILKFIGISASIIIVIFAYLQVVEIFLIPKSLDDKIQILIIILIIILLVIYHKRSKNSSFFEFPLPRPYVILGFFIAMSILAVYYSNVISLQINWFVAMPLMFLGLLLGINGVKKLIDSISIKKQSYKTLVFVVIMIAIIIPISYFNVAYSIPYLNHYSAGGFMDYQTSLMKTVPSQIKNLEPEDVLVHSPPGPLFITTGNPVIAAPEDIISSPLNIAKYFERYNATYYVNSPDDAYWAYGTKMIAAATLGLITVDQINPDSSIVHIYKIKYSDKILSDPITKAIILEKQGKSDEALKNYNQIANKIKVSDMNEAIKLRLLSYEMGWYETKKSTFVINQFTNSTHETMQARINLATKINDRINLTFPTFTLEEDMVMLKALGDLGYYAEAYTGYRDFINHLDNESIKPTTSAFENQSLEYSKNTISHYKMRAWNEIKIMQKNEHTSDSQGDIKVRESYDNIYKFLKQSMHNSDESARAELKSIYLRLIDSEIEYWQDRSNFEFMHDAYTELTSYDQFNKEGWWGLATTAEKTGDIQEAIVDYQYYLKLIGNSTESGKVQEKIDSLQKILGHE